jgi:hypothetical protein
MPINERPSPPIKTRLPLGIKLLIAVVIIGFAVLHIVGDAVLRSPSVAAKADAVGSNNYGD